FVTAPHALDDSACPRPIADVPPSSPAAARSAQERTAMTVPDALFSPGYWDKSLEVADALRAQGPVHRAVMPNDVRVWVIGRYDHARVALADPRLSKDFAGLKTIIGAQLAEAGHEQKVSGMVSPHMLCQDGDEHTRLRKLVAAQFTRTRIEQLRPRIEQLTTAL